MAGLLTGLVALTLACGGSSGSTASSSGENLSVTNVERVFITRPLGGPLETVLVYLDFEPSVPPSLILEALGSDGALHKGVKPMEAKICGFPAYLGLGQDAGNEGNRRTLAFIVGQGVKLVELHWRTGADGIENVTPLPEQTVVCTPEDFR